MKVEGGEKGLMLKILNKQFKMIGEKMTFEDLPQDGIITVNGKKKYWYEHYKFDSFEQEKEWRDWSYKQLELMGEQNAKTIMDYAELRYGFTVRYKKKGELF